MEMSRVLRFAAVLLTVALIAPAAALVGCGGDESSGGSDSAAAEHPGFKKEIADTLPEAIKSKGTLIAATDATFPPLEFMDADGETITGVDPELITAIGNVLGLKVKVVNAKFDSIIPGLQAGNYDVAISWFNDRKDREEVVDMVVYGKSGNTYYVNADVDPSTISKPEDLCDKRYAVMKGSSQAAAAAEQKKACGGKLEVMEFPDQNAINLALAAGRADIANAGTPVALYAMSKANGRLALVDGLAEDPHPVGIAVPKGGGLAQPILDALKALMADGTYEEIFKKYGIDSKSAITDPVINGAPDEPAE